MEGQVQPPTGANSGVLFKLPKKQNLISDTMGAESSHQELHESVESQVSGIQERHFHNKSVVRSMSRNNEQGLYYDETAPDYLPIRGDLLIAKTNEDRF